MKKTLLTFSLLVSTAAVAQQYKVPNVGQGNAPLPLLSPDTPLSERDYKALKYAKQWLKGKRYPYKDGDRVVYLYGAGQPTLVCSPLKLCVIYFQPGEKVVNNGVHLGDTVRWQVSPAIGADQRTQLIVKPVDSGLNTSLVVITDRRTYHIKLFSRKKDFMPGIAFKYPGDMAEQWAAYYNNQQQTKAHNEMPEGVQLSDLDFNYSVSSCKSCNFKPIRVYNNGTQTVIEMEKTLRRGDAPALLVSSKQGKELVNYRLVNGKYIVDRLFEKAILVRGVGRKQEKVIITWSSKK